MNEQVKKKWIAALRSGEYLPTNAALRSNGGWCCLGVLCDLHAKETGNQWQTGEGWDIYLGQTAYLPLEVKSWAGLDDNILLARECRQNFDIFVDETKVQKLFGDDKFVPPGCTLAALNDEGFTFKEIALVIKELL